MADKGRRNQRGAAPSRESLLFGIATVFLALALVGMFYLQAAGSRQQGWQQALDALRMDAREAATLASDLGHGSFSGAAGRPATPREALLGLSASVERMRTRLAALDRGSPEAGIAAVPASARGALSAASASGEALQSDIAALLRMAEPYLAVQRAAHELSQAIPAVTGQYEQISTRLANRSAPTGPILAAGQLVRLERMKGLLRDVTGDAAVAGDRAEQLDRESRAFVRNHQAIADASGGDPQSAPLIRDVNESYGPVTIAAATIAQQAVKLGGLPATIDRIDTSARQFDSALATLQAAISEVSRPGGLPGVLTLAAGVLAVLLMLAFAWASLRSARQRQLAREEQDARQQAAILSLLDEITNLADGDLTVDVTVTEDFTGAIADSINYTVDTLRRLVGTITDTSVELAASATSTRSTAQAMSVASERQAHDIAEVTGVIMRTSESLGEVATRAEQLSKDATNSVQVAHNGAATVGRTIQGMASLREQIQETAKRIKRLGESSQEIGNIIEFINDIADQTNTLALNASIQAAMAGEAGRGFAVVADEVQRLAERAASATRQIENLVRTIQADTNEAIISMERSTSNVVAGAKSAEEAGQALTRIESTSTDLSRLIQDISVSARSQSASATRIAGQMQAIRDIAVQTSGAAGQTEQAVSELSALSEKLRGSVAGFKLPSHGARRDGVDLADAA